MRGAITLEATLGHRDVQVDTTVGSSATNTQSSLGYYEKFFAFLCIGVCDENIKLLIFFFGIKEFIAFEFKTEGL
jgi:hypothetical protein